MPIPSPPSFQGLGFYSIWIGILIVIGLIRILIWFEFIGIGLIGILIWFELIGIGLIGILIWYACPLDSFPCQLSQHEKPHRNRHGSVVWRRPLELWCKVRKIQKDGTVGLNWFAFGSGSSNIGLSLVRRGKNRQLWQTWWGMRFETWKQKLCNSGGFEDWKFELWIVQLRFKVKYFSLF